MKTILMIDDEIEIAELYKEALIENNYSVVLLEAVDDVFDGNHIVSSNIDAIILDIMMPEGHRYANKETNGGLKTGKLLYDDLRNLFPQIPIVILTNVSDFHTTQLFASSSNVFILEKIHYSPDELVTYLSAIITGSGDDGMPK